MTYPSFLNLLLELEPYVRSSGTQFTRPLLSMKKVVAMVMYKFTHVVSAPIMAERFNVGALTVRKYVDIVVDAFVSHEKLFDKYIYILHRKQL